MFQAVGYDLYYRRVAFESGRYGTPTYPELKAAFEQAQVSVLAKGDGRWMISNNRGDLLNNDKRVIGLMVIVPAGDDQYEQYLAVVDHFEEVMAACLGVPIDTTFSTIESGGPKCEICGAEPKWVRAIRVPGFSCSTHFCAVHAQEQEDFRYSGPSTFFWHQLEVVTV